MSDSDLDFDVKTSLELLDETGPLADLSVSTSMSQKHVDNWGARA